MIELLGGSLAMSRLVLQHRIAKLDSSLKLRSRWNTRALVDLLTRDEDFHNEAVRLWDLEDGRSSIIRHSDHYAHRFRHDSPRTSVI